MRNLITKVYYVDMSDTFSVRIIKDETDYHPERVSATHVFQQSFWYGTLQEKMGREVLRFEILNGTSSIGYAQIIIYPFFRTQWYAYCPYGPVVSVMHDKIAFVIARAIPLHTSKKIICTRLHIPTSAKTTFPTTSKSLVRGGFVQPHIEWEVTLQETDEKLFDHYHKQTRKNIRKAESLGVTIEIHETELTQHLPVLFSILYSTAEKNNFSLHTKDYYKTMIELIDTYHNGFIAIAYGKDNAALSISVHIIEQSVCHAVFGGSLLARRDEYAPFILKWQAMRHARTRGATVFRMGGVVPPGEEHRYKSWVGFTHFKQSFDGHYVEHGTVVDVIYRNVAYKVVATLKTIYGWLRPKK